VGQILDSRFIRGLIAFLLTVIAIICGVYSVLLFVQIFHGHGSSEGNAYLFTFALILLIFFPIAFAFAIHYWKSCKVGSGDECA
jgi:uncharacterized membrane protein